MKKLLLATLPVMCFASPAYAQSAVDFDDRKNRPYVSFGAGFNELGDTDFNFATGVDVENEYDTGYSISGELGYNFGELLFVDNVKLGLELGYTENDIDVHNIAALGGAQPSSTGDLSAFTILANMYHEYDTGTRFVPYYGLGLGVAIIDAKDYGVAAAPQALDDEEAAFLYQGTVGVNYMLTSDIDVGARYRYAATAGGEWTGAGAGAQSQDLDYENHIFAATLNYRF